MGIREKQRKTNPKWFLNITLLSEDPKKHTPTVWRKLTENREDNNSLQLHDQKDQRRARKFKETQRPRRSRCSQKKRL